MSQKATLRAAVRTALAAAIPTVTWKQDWWAAINPVDLPLGGVSTPRETVRRLAVGAVDREIDLVVLIKRDGDKTIEDVLDADAAAIEIAVLPVLAQYSDDYDLSQVDVSPDPGAERITGSIVATFRVVLKTPEANPN